MADTRTMVTLGLGALVCGTVYVLLHERKRKRKKIARLAEDQPITKEMLLRILNKSAEHSKSIIERIHVEVRKIKEAGRGRSGKPGRSGRPGKSGRPGRYFPFSARRDAMDVSPAGPFSGGQGICWS